MLSVTAYIVRGLQLILGTSKRAMTERAEELGDERDDIPLTSTRAESEYSPSLADEIQAPLRAQDPAQITGTGGPPVDGAASSLLTSSSLLHRQAPAPLTRSQVWAAFINLHLDVLIYSIAFVFIGLPIYFVTGYAMPAHLALNVLGYFAALELPPLWRRFLHPALVASVATVVGIWILASIHGDTLVDGLHAYQTKTRYIQLLNGQHGLPRPGAGDIFSSILDVSIVGLALPMFSYRQELKRQVTLHWV